MSEPNSLHQGLELKLRKLLTSNLVAQLCCSHSLIYWHHFLLLAAAAVIPNDADVLFLHLIMCFFILLYLKFLSNYLMKAAAALAAIIRPSTGNCQRLSSLVVTGCHLFSFYNYFLFFFFSFYLQPSGDRHTHTHAGVQQFFFRQCRTYL